MFKLEAMATAPIASTPIPSQTTEPRSGLYSAIWRWHFYAALFVIPFVLVFAVTGSIYLFKSQIENELYRDLYRVAPVGKPIAPESQVQAALSAYPGSVVEAYIPPKSPSHSALVRVKTTDRQKMTVAVNPGTGAVPGAINEQQRPLQVIREFHGKLLLGKTGQAVQELAASWTMILILTGLYLWWPRRGSKLLGTFLPRLKTSGRIFWRDLHSITGFWISGLLIFLIVTGLPWSVVSGDLIHQAASRIGRGSPDTGIGWDGGGSHTVQSPHLGQDWTTTHAQQLAGKASSQRANGQTPLPLSQVLRIAQATPSLAAPYEIRMPVDERGVYSIVTAHDGKPENTAYIHLDQYTGDIVKEVRWHDFGPLAKAIAIGVALHEGRYFGLPNQLLGLAACWGLIFMIIAGIGMGWHRHAVSTSGPPALPTGFRLTPSLIGLTLLLAILMPLFGASLLVIAASERLLRKRTPR